MNKFDNYRDLLEQWAEWWNNIGRYHFQHHIIPPISETSKALSCIACHNVDALETVEKDQRCKCCGRKI